MLRIDTNSVCCSTAGIANRSVRFISDRLLVSIDIEIEWSPWDSSPYLWISYVGYQPFHSGDASATVPSYTAAVWPEIWKYSQLWSTPTRSIPSTKSCLHCEIWVLSMHCLALFSVLRILHHSIHHWRRRMAERPRRYVNLSTHSPQNHHHPLPPDYSCIPLFHCTLLSSSLSIHKHG